jgi:hypothetical protein
VTDVFFVHDHVVIFWYPWQYVPTVDCMAETHCACGLVGFVLGDLLSSWPQALLLGLALLDSSGFALKTHCTHGLGFAMGNLLCSWPWALPLGLALLVASGFALGTHFAQGPGFTLGTRQNFPHYLDQILSTHIHSSLIK